MEFSALERKIGHAFKNRALLEQALTHSSWANENRGEEDNERLEFLGDAVLELAMSDWLFAEYPALPEGELTRMRASLVCVSALAGAARGLGLGEYLRLGRGEEQGGGRERASILEACVEALIGSLYLDGGLSPAREFVTRFLTTPQKAAGQFRDYKTLLQERVQKNRDDQLCYSLVGESGPDHNKKFTVQALINGQAAGEGEGDSKKAAEQAAARQALKLRYGEEL